MHASYQIIIQVLQLAYTTQACISNLKNLCNASKHMTMHISNATNQSSWACSPYLCASLVQELLIHLFSPILLPLCPCPCPTSTSLSQFLPKLSYLLNLCPKAFTISPKAKLSYLCTISLPLSSISIKGVLLIDAKVCIWGRWLKLESCIIDGHHLIVGMIPLVDTTCMLYHLYLVGLLKMPHIGSLILISICGTPPPMW